MHAQERAHKRARTQTSAHTHIFHECDVAAEPEASHLMDAPFETQPRAHSFPSHAHL